MYYLNYFCAFLCQKTIKHNFIKKWKRIRRYQKSIKNSEDDNNEEQG